MTAETYPCEKCGKPRTKAEGGTTFTVCDACWGLAADDIMHQQKAEIEALKAEVKDKREQLLAMARDLNKSEAERDEWRDKAGLHQIASAAHKTRADKFEAEAMNLKAERDEARAREDAWRTTAHESAAQRGRLADACRDLNKGIHRLRKGRDNAINRAKEAKESLRLAEQYADRLRRECSDQAVDLASSGRAELRAEVARLEGLIVESNLCTKPTAESCDRNCALSQLHAEARAIKARQGA